MVKAKYNLNKEHLSLKMDLEHADLIMSLLHFVELDTAGYGACAKDLIDAIRNALPDGFIINQDVSVNFDSYEFTIRVG